MNSFDEYTVVFRASVAVPKEGKLNLDMLLAALTRRLETAGHEQFLVGNSGIHAVNETKEREPF